LSRGEYLEPHDRFLTVTTAFGLLLGVALLAAIVANA
jgi:hypothetical protein